MGKPKRKARRQSVIAKDGWLRQKHGWKDSATPAPLLLFKPSQHSQQTPLIQLSLIKLLIGLGISMGPGQGSRLLSCSWVTPPMRGLSSAALNSSSLTSQGAQRQVRAQKSHGWAGRSTGRLRLLRCILWGHRCFSGCMGDLYVHGCASRCTGVFWNQPPRVPSWLSHTLRLLFSHL